MGSELLNCGDAGPLAASCRLAQCPFDLRREDAYRRWRDAKLGTQPAVPDHIEISDPYHLSTSERDKLKACCELHNFCLYSFAKVPEGDARDAVVALGRALGLRTLDPPANSDGHPVATISVGVNTCIQEYIPYTNQPINWHTDGYYNSPTTQIRGVTMHCAQPAGAGGANVLLDPELVYIKVREADRKMIEALMAADAMCIPANIRGGVEIRPARSGPVFSMDYYTGKLHMRYTARSKSVDWSSNPDTETAAGILREILTTSEHESITVLLEAHQGIVCNNVLHTRDGFGDSDPADKSRTVLRARYYDRVAET